MKKKYFKSVIAFVLSLVLFNQQIDCFAAGKTVEAFKNNNHSGKSDCQEMIDGLNGQVSYSSSYKGVYDGISQLDFENKSKAIKYWASHGSNSGNLWGDSKVNFNIIKDINNLNWSGSNLEFVFLAACNQLDGAGSNPRSHYARAMLGNNAVRVICGYHASAPRAGVNYDASIVRNFIAIAKSKESVKSAWIKANQIYGTSNYCVLTHSGNVQYSRFEGFPGQTYARPNASSKSILRFSSANPNGTNQPYSINGLSSKEELKHEIQNLDIPNYSIKKKNISLEVKPEIETVVLNIGDYLTTQNGEIGDREVNLTEESALDEAKKWLDNSFESVKLSDFADAKVMVNPIVMAEVDLDGNVSNETETCVAYDISFNTLFNGIPVHGDKYCSIVDSNGVISSAINHNEYEIVEKNMLVDSVLFDSNIEKFGNALNEKNIDLTELSSISLEFYDKDGDGIFNPTLIFDSSNGVQVYFDCHSGNYNIMD